MSETPNLKLPYLAAAQSQKHVTHNEALRALDALAQLAVVDRGLASPPATPSDGDRYIVGPSPTGSWSGKAGQIAAWQDGAWMFYAAKAGWLAWVAGENALYAFDGTGWTGYPPPGGGGGGATSLSVANRTATTLDVASDTGADATLPAATTALAGLLVAADKAKLDGIEAGATADMTGAEIAAALDGQSPQTLALLGINATADATNRLALAAAASLFNHAGAGHQHKINKAAATDTAAIVFQTGFSGRAEIGTAGDDDLHVKVSADGAAWTEAIVIDRTTGAVSLPGTVLADFAGAIDLGGAQASGTLAAARFPALTGDVTTVAGALAAAIAADAVSNVKLANVATATLKGRATAGTGDPEDLTGTQATALLDLFTSALKGLAPASGGGTVNFLRADGTWAEPPGSAGWTRVRKTADEARTATTAITADSTLKFAMAANTRYNIRARIYYDTGATEDFKWRHSGPASPTLVRLRRVGLQPNATTFAIIALDTAYSAADVVLAGTAANGGWVDIDGIVVNGATAGDFVFGWAQNTAGTNPTTVLAGSYIEYSTI